jgi:two-component system response regulator MprA
MSSDTPADGTLLLVEDNEVMREGLTVVLRHAGYAVTLAANGQEALSALRGGVRPDLILLDMLVPVVDGWRFLEQRRRQPALLAIPVVILTGLGVASPEWATALGAAGLLRKPVETEELLREVRRCRRDNRRQRLLQAVRGPADPPQTGWVTGLTRAEAEGLLDWLEANGYPPAELSFTDGVGFAVRCPGFQGPQCRNKGPGV